MRRKVLLVAMIIAILLQYIMPFTMVYAVTSVEITLNSTLYKAVKSQLKEQGITASYRDANGMIVISQEELAKVTTLNLANSEIDDLTGLDAFDKVTSLNLHANKLTVDSNLQVLDSLNLKDLDLSSNQLSSVKSISSINEIEKSDITDQRITERQIIKVDDSEDAESQITKVTVTLPDILLEDGDQIKPEWLINNLGEPTREIIAVTPGYSPEIDFENSFAPGSTDLVLNVANGYASSYKALRGLIKFQIKVNDSTSKLANTQMTFYYAIVNSEETGVAFDDENMYKAVKQQLSQNQTINDDLKETTNSRNIFSKDYDEALILVISQNDIVNKIPSLILNDKRVTDLKGLEEFVGLESNLDISYNYITTIKRIIELEENKANEETRIRQKYSKVLTELKTNVTAYDAEQEKIKTADKNYDKANSELSGLTDPAAIAAKRNEIQGYLEQKTVATEASARYLNLVNKYTSKLYKIYEKEYKLISLLPKEVNYLSYKELLESDVNTLKSYSTTIMDRVSKLEKTNGLIDFETWAIKRLLGGETTPSITGWGATHGITFKTTKRVFSEAYPTGHDEAIEYPISEFFEEVKADTTLDINAYKEFIYIFKCIDALSQIEQYTSIKRTFERSSGDYAAEALKDILKVYDQKGYDTYFYDKIRYKDDTEKVDGNYLRSRVSKEGYEIDTSVLYPVHIGISKADYAGGIAEDVYKLKLAHRQNLITEDDIETYINLPRVRKLNMADNNTRSLEGLEALTELQELNAWKNIVNNISNVNWESFSKMKKLNLGYNQISDISPLQVIYTLEELNTSYNLLSGRFTFRLINMKNLMEADFSHNQYSDIQYAHDQYILKAMGYDRNFDGIADGLTVPEYLRITGKKLSFQYQSIEMATTMVKTDEEFVEFELPLIFRQLEQLDNEKTSFGVDSLGGLVESEGRTVKLRMPEAGTTGKTVVTVEGRNGSVGGYSIEGVGYGTTCTISYTVLEQPSISNPTDPSNPGEQQNPSNPSNPTNPTNPEDSNIEFGYNVVDGYVMVYMPETTKMDFARRLVDLEKYNVTIAQNKSDTKIGTGSVVTIVSKADPTVEVMLEVVVKGDINGDGEVDALDSGIVRNIIADKVQEVGVYKAAADVNCDGAVDSQDSMLILKYRADRITSFED